MNNFEKIFLDNYLRFGLGSMPKSDIDALVMHLLDVYGLPDSGPLSFFSNQTVSERLKTPVTKVKKLRYEASLKFGGSIKDQAMGRLLAALSKASFEPDGDKIYLIIEDSLAKNWLQGQFKYNQHLFDNSFNREIVKVSAGALFQVLETVFDKEELSRFKADYDATKKQGKTEERISAFKEIVLNFTKGAAHAAGKGVFEVFKSHVGCL